jgi:hypothetical protein
MTPQLKDRSAAAQAAFWKAQRYEEILSKFEDFMERRSRQLVDEYVASGIPLAQAKMKAKDYLWDLLHEFRQNLLNWGLDFWLEKQELDNVSYLAE